MTPSPASGAVTVLIVEDQPVIRLGIRTALETVPDFRVVAEAGTADMAFKYLADLRPSAAVIDVSLPDLNGIDLARKIHMRLPEFPILIYSGFTQPVHARRALKAGACGFVTKDEPLDILVNGLRSVANHIRFIGPTTRERMRVMSPPSAFDRVVELSPKLAQVFRYVTQGLSTRDICDRTNTKAKTVETQRADIRKRLGLDSESFHRFVMEWVACGPDG